MAMEEGQTIAEAGKLDKFPYEASTAAASRWSGKPRPHGPCRQIWRHRPDCHCNRQGMLERFFLQSNRCCLFKEEWPMPSDLWLSLPQARHA